MNSLTLREITDSKEFESLAEVWDNLLQKCGNENSIFLTHEWLFTWWQHFAEDRQLNILLVEKDCHVLAIVPLMKTNYKNFKIHFLETIGTTNCNYICIIPPENRKEAMAILMPYFKKAINNNLVLKLNMIPDDCQSLDLFCTQVNLLSDELYMKTGIETLAPYTLLPKTWEEYYGSIKGHRRYTLRTALRRLEETHTVEFKEYSAGSLADGLSHLFDLHQKRWQSIGIRSVFSDPEWQEFYSDISSKFCNRGWLHFSCLMVDSKVASSIWSFVYNHKYYYSTVARDLIYEKFRVGHLHCMNLIKYAIQKQLQEYDFLRGEEPYKFSWAKTARKYITVTVIKKGFGAGLRLKYVNTFLLFQLIGYYGPMGFCRLKMMEKGWKKEIRRLEYLTCLQ